MKLAISNLTFLFFWGAACAASASPIGQAKTEESVLSLDQRSHLVGLATIDIGKNWIYVQSKERGYELFSEGPKWDTYVYRKADKIYICMPLTRVKAQTSLNGAYGAFSVLTDLKAPLSTRQYTRDKFFFEDVTYGGQVMDRSYISAEIDKSVNEISKVTLTSLKWNITREQNVILCKLSSWPSAHDIPFKSHALFRDGSVSTSMLTIACKSRKMIKPRLPDLRGYKATDYISHVCYPADSSQILNDLLVQPK